MGVVGGADRGGVEISCKINDNRTERDGLKLMTGKFDIFGRPSTVVPVEGVLGLPDGYCFSH